jgi:tRNA(Arg) A34 adenosine deaminase TadA
MPASIPEFITYCAYVMRGALNADVAIAARPGGEILGVARDTRAGAQDISTPMVNLLQHADWGGNYFVSTTLAPTEACLGIAKLRQVAWIYEFAGAGLRRRNLPGAPLWNNLQAPPGNLPVLAGINSIAGFAAMAANARSQAAAVLTGNLGANQQAQAIYDDAVDSVILGRIPAPAAMAVPLAIAAAAAFTPLRDRLFMCLAHAIVAARVMNHGGAGGHSIGCVLVDGNGSIAAYAVNNVTVNPTFHAETLVVMQYGATNNYGGFPANGRLYTTLQCCHMCAGFVATAGANFAVRYAQTDPIMNNNALARNVNGCTETLQDSANVGHQTMVAVGPGHHQITQILNSQIGTIFSMEAVHAYRKLRFYVNTVADVALWQQGRTIINGICPNLIN